MATLLDTTVLIDVLRGRTSAPQDTAPLSCSVVSVAEIYAGLRSHEESPARALFTSLRTYDITPKIAERAGRISAAGRAEGKTVLLPDLLIAATALEHGCTLLTSNAKDFRGVEGLQVEEI